MMICGSEWVHTAVYGKFHSVKLRKNSWMGLTVKTAKISNPKVLDNFVYSPSPPPPPPPKKNPRKCSTLRVPVLRICCLHVLSLLDRRRSDIHRTSTHLCQPLQADALLHGQGDRNLPVRCEWGLLQTDWASARSGSCVRATVRAVYVLLLRCWFLPSVGVEKAGLYTANWLHCLHTGPQVP